MQSDAICISLECGRFDSFKSGIMCGCCNTAANSASAREFARPMEKTFEKFLSTTQREANCSGERLLNLQLCLQFATSCSCVRSEKASRHDWTQARHLPAEKLRSARRTEAIFACPESRFGLPITRSPKSLPIGEEGKRKNVREQTRYSTA